MGVYGLAVPEPWGEARVSMPCYASSTLPAPLMIVGEGTNEIQRNVIAAQLVKRGGIDLP